MMNEGNIGSDDRGAVVVMTLFATTFLVGLIWYLVGVGDALVFHERLQDGADAVAFAPSVLHARGMNLIALVNLVMAATLAVLIAVKVVQILLFAANVIACVSQSWGDCVYLANWQSPYAQFVDRVDNDVARLHRTLHSTSTNIARNMPLLAAEHGVRAAKGYGPFVQGGFAVSVSLVPGSVEGGVGGQMTDGGRASSERDGLPVEDDDYANLCVHAGVEGTGVYPILWQPIRRQGWDELESKIKEYAGALEMPVAMGYPRMFCGGGGYPSAGPIGMIDGGGDVGDDVCPGGRRLRWVSRPCKAGMGAAMNAFHSASALGTSRSPSKRIYSPARMGDDYFATWGVTTSDFIEHDLADRGVQLALNRRAAAPGSTVWSQAEMDRTLRETQISKSEFFYSPRANGPRSWPGVRAEAMWNLRWKARLRRQRQPSEDMARLLAGPGSGYIASGASGSNADVMRITGTLVTASPNELAAWADRNVGPVSASRSTGGMVH
jgi:hypothetical protein